MNVRMKSLARLALVFGLLLLLSGCMCLPRGTHRGGVEKKEAEKADGPPTAGQSSEGDRQKEVSHDHDGAPAEVEKNHEHGASGGHLGHMGLDLRSPWTWAVGGGMAVMMVLML